jgi:hypothetical protein
LYDRGIRKNCLRFQKIKKTFSKKIGNSNKKNVYPTINRTNHPASPQRPFSLKFFLFFHILL